MARHSDRPPPGFPNTAGGGVGDARNRDSDGTNAGRGPQISPCPSPVAAGGLAESEQRYRRLFEAARDGILLLDVETGRITDANPFVTELLGYPREELLGRELWELGLFADREANQFEFRQLLEKGHTRYEDLPLRARDGRSCEVEFVSGVYREDDHQVIQCNIRDITERKRIEQALEAALARELHITAALQQPLLADVAEEPFPGVLVAACYEPVLREAEVGGDFVDAFAVPTPRGANPPRTRIGLVVGDVTGKGVRAAMLAGRVKDILRAFLYEDSDPAATLARLNHYLCSAVSRRGCGPASPVREAFVAVALVVLDPLTGEASLASAGAEPPAVLRADGRVEVITARGLLLGVQPVETYRACRFDLPPGDTLLMATDGITEARRPARPAERAAGTEPDLLGYDGMLAIAVRYQAAGSLSAMGRGVLQEARAFGGGFRDDACLLLARRR